MIKINLDEGHVFDMLSILDVKLQKHKFEKYDKIKESYEILKDEIVKQIGKDKFDLIYQSVQYAELISINKLIFELVDKVKTVGGLAKDVDDANYKRYVCKKNLQESFFNSSLMEQKDTNYNE